MMTMANNDESRQRYQRPVTQGRNKDVNLIIGQKLEGFAIAGDHKGQCVWEL